MQLESNKTGVHAGDQGYAEGQAANAASEKPRKGDYKVGRGRPPLHSRWKPGQSGNPKGRRKGQRNAKTEIKEIMESRVVSVGDGETAYKPSLLAANVFAHGIKGAKGDVRSAGLFLNQATRMGLLDPEVDAAGEHVARDQRAILIAPPAEPLPSDLLLKNLDLGLLSSDEKIELSRLTSIIDLGGDITALSTDDFARVKHIVNKGRGKDITPR